MKRVRRKPGKKATRKRKVRFSANDWATDYAGTLDRWLHWYLPRNLTKLWRSYPPRSAAKTFAERNGCRICGKVVAREGLDVDHIDPKGSVPREVGGWGEYFKRYFCAPENLQGICKDPCHKLKTAEEKKRGYK